VSIRERNEALDLEVYALAALYIGGQSLLRSLEDRAARFARPVGELPKPTKGPERPMRRQGEWIPRQQGWVRGWRR
jgi:phage terminase large subunit GpA-like protein